MTFAVPTVMPLIEAQRHEVEALEWAVGLQEQAAEAAPSTNADGCLRDQTCLQKGYPPWCPRTGHSVG